MSTKKTAADVSTDAVLEAFNRNKGNIRATAKELGISRSSVRRRLTPLGVMKKPLVGGTKGVADTARASELDALQQQNNALRRSWGFEVQGASDRFQAPLAEQGGILSGLGTLANTAGKYYNSTQNT